MTKFNPALMPGSLRLFDLAPSGPESTTQQLTYRCLLCNEMNAASPDECCDDCAGTSEYLAASLDAALKAETRTVKPRGHKPGCGCVVCNPRKRDVSRSRHVPGEIRAAVRGCGMSAQELSSADLRALEVLTSTWRAADAELRRAEQTGIDLEAWRRAEASARGELRELKDALLVCIAPGCYEHRYQSDRCVHHLGGA